MEVGLLDSFEKPINGCVYTCGGLNSVRFVVRIVVRIYVAGDIKCNHTI